jgi:hypothetical protein
MQFESEDNSHSDKRHHTDGDPSIEEQRHRKLFAIALRSEMRVMVAKAAQEEKMP